MASGQSISCAAAARSRPARAFLHSSLDSLSSRSEPAHRSCSCLLARRFRDSTSVIAARDGEADIALGNIIGSNIFNILGILGLSALLRPVTITGLSAVDFGMMIATAALLWPLLGARGRLARAEGVILLLIYAGYLIWLVNAM